MEILPTFCKPLSWSILDLKDEDYNSIDKTFEEYPMEEKITSSNQPYRINTSDKMYVLEDKKMINVKQKIEKEFSLLWHDNLKYKNDFKITKSWFTEIKGSGALEWHKHTNCMFSGVFYFGEYFSRILFRDYNVGTSFHLKATEQNILNSTDWFIDPQKGLVIFWPSEIYHTVIEKDMRVNDMRKSLAFNIVPIGTYGKEDSEVTVNYELDN
jgi:hypothetical protein